MGIIDSFVYAHNHHCRNPGQPREFWRLHVRNDSIYDCSHSSLRPCVSDKLPDKTSNVIHPCSQSQISTSSQLSDHYSRERQLFQGWAIYTRSGDGETLCWLGRSRTFISWKNIFHALSCHHNGSAPRVCKEQNPLQQYS